MISPRVGVLALQGDVREHLAGLEAAGAVGSAVRRPAELDAVDALVIPGGESTTMYKLAVAFDMFEPLRKRVDAGMPVYGSCAGMIMLADRLVDGIEGQLTLGGLDITVRRNAFGRQVDSFEASVPARRRRWPAVSRRLHPRAVGREASGRRSRCSAGCRTARRLMAARVGSSPSGRASCSRPPSIRNSRGITAFTRFSSKSFANT